MVDQQTPTAQPVPQEPIKGKGEKLNPLSQEEILKRIEATEADKELQQAIAEQEMIKMRIEMQNGEYSPPAGFEKYPSLAPTKKITQDTTEKEVNPDLGESVIEVTPQGQKVPVQVKTDGNNNPVQSSQGIKG